MKTKNLNISSMHSMIRKIYHEVENSVSQDVSHMRKPDITRLKSYVDEFESYQSHTMSQDPMDWPHSHKLEINLNPLPAVTEQENTTIHELLQFLHIVDAELVESQSKDLPSGLYSFDNDRLKKNIGYVRSLIAHVEDATPTDRPESASTEFKAQQG